ncbi:MAG: DNA polymerase III subunit gamma/tau [Myxococcota bacterium]|nr:DNA polymerase III subunit gamma/tau [Myxococcota bacterium]
MSYQVLARKWRPQSFEEVTGQEHVTTALRNAIATGRVPHAILLCGPRGVGKTTIARIIARCLNCEKGPTATPCGTCSSCVEIAAGRSTDVQEIDAASRTSVDDVREVIESIRYAAAPGKHRIFVIDEVHMLSVAAFNALLKTLEEPPPRSLFVFATTNAEKLPATVISRCQRHDLRRLPTAEVAARLGAVAQAEGVTISPRSLQVIARQGEGSLRDSITLLDQVIAVSGNEVDDARVAAVLDLTDRRVLLAIVAACVEGDPAAALAACAHASELGIEAKRLGEDLIGVLRDLVVLRVAPDAAGLVEGSDAEIDELRQLASRNEVGRLRRMFRALIQEQEDLAWAPQPFAVLEMAIVRLATLAGGEDVQALLQRLDALERRLSGSAPPDPGPNSAPPRPRSSGGGPPPRSGSSARTATTAAPTATLAAPIEEPRAAAIKKPLEATPEAKAHASEFGSADFARSEAKPSEAPASGADAPRAASHRRAEPIGTARSGTSTDRESSGSMPDDSPPPQDSDLFTTEAAEEEVPPPTDDDAPVADLGTPAAAWLDRLRALATERDRTLGAALEGAELLARTDKVLRIRVPQAFAAHRVERRRTDLEEVCARLAGRPLRIEVVGPDAGARGEAASGGEETVRRRRRDALAHPAVNTVLEILGGEVVEIRPQGDAPR